MDRINDRPLTKKEVDTYNTTYGNNPAFSQNLDFFSYPRPMMWNLGLTVGF